MNKPRAKKIIIIGAGIAGLSACNQLVDYGFDTVILEARNRIGGRIWMDNSIGSSISLGASWIHGVDGNPIAELASKHNLKMNSVDSNKFSTLDRRGNLIQNENIQNFEQMFTDLLNNAKQMAFKSNSDISLATAFSKLLKDKILSEVESDLFRKKLSFFEGYLGASYEQLSARYWDQDGIWPGENCFLTDTYQSIITGLSDKCSIKLNAVVKEIKLLPNEVEVITQNEVFKADAVIVTIPLGVLKNEGIKFIPALPQDKQSAIKNLGMGVFNITYMKFPRIFWPKEKHAIFFTKPSLISIFFNAHLFANENVIIGYSGGQSGLQVEALSDDQIKKTVEDDFKFHFGDHVMPPIVFKQTRWSKDPYSFGSYSFIKTGSSVRDYNILSQPVANQLFFAGEATSSKYPATTHGAYLSGFREAERIYNLFSTQ